MLSDDICIAGIKTVGDWKDLKQKLLGSKDSKLWEKAFKDFFYARLRCRYLRPIDSIKIKEKYLGEGFSIMTILCSLIEYLEATYQGKSYRYLRRGESLGPHEYNMSKEIFVSFLTQRTPFNSYFDPHLAEEFYKNVRCGLLHSIYLGYSRGNNVFIAYRLLGVAYSIWTVNIMFLGDFLYRSS
jgi:hypothetical protein